MRAELKRLHSPDIDDLKSFMPDNINSFSFLLQIMVGQVNLEGEESFDAIVCTPSWLMNEYKKSEVLFLRHFIIVFEYNYKTLFTSIKQKIESIEYSGWNELGKKMSEIGKWEFEDYNA